MNIIFKKAFYNIAGFPLVHHLGRPWRGRACVLCYHRVLPDDEFEADKSPNSDLVMPISRFSEQMKFLSENHEVVSMDELVGHLEGGSNNFVVAITFDDGYRDNLVHALPILKKYNIPTTIYITTRFPGGDTWMWWYEIWDYLEKKVFIELNSDNKHYEWIIKTKKQRLSCFNELLMLIMKLSSQDQEVMVRNLTNNLYRKQYPELCLSWSEIKMLDQQPLVTIGAHTHTHPNLKQLMEKEVFLEISKSKTLLEEKLEHSVEHFAYPFGTANEAYTREYEIATRCGFRTAVTTIPEMIQSPNLNAIPRLGVPSYLNLVGFRGKLSGGVHRVRKIFTSMIFL